MAPSYFFRQSVIATTTLQKQKTDSAIHVNKLSNLRTSVSAVLLLISLATVVDLAEAITQQLKQG